ncbi:MAG: A/G-specific adenine glycosylase [Phycisphaerales bacterium]|nr:A/G-specific adenine glycosylase [Phycisphaerales bacterium]
MTPPPGTSPPPRDARIARDLSAWFARSARDLPWRRPLPGHPRRDPYHALVAEVMLQQTQVSRVLEYFPRFIGRFPTPAALAEAGEQQVLAAWAGLGYYRRARLLHHAARAIAADHAGEVPSDPGLLRALPGVGRYTAGALASIVFEHPEPIVDGNVRRVLIRLEGRDLDETPRREEAWAWQRASELVAAAEAPGVFNEALMELGATVCLPSPARPDCPLCPLRTHCRAAELGRQADLPRPKPRARQSVVHHAAVLIRDGRGRLLVEQRPGRGLWAGMWQAPTLESPKPVTAPALARWFGVPRLRRLARFTHHLTHREVRFSVWAQPEGDAPPGAGAPRRFATIRQIAGLPLANPHRRILLEQAGPLSPPRRRAASSA